jgi:DNA-binding response OmpR family regulator
MLVVLAVVPDPGEDEILAVLADPGTAEILAAAAAAPSCRRVGPITIDPAARRVTLAGRPLALTRREYELLVHLAAAPGRVFTKQELLQSIWSTPVGGAPTRRLDAQVARLRRRLGDHRALLVTVWGVGYRLGGVEHP